MGKETIKDIIGLLVDERIKAEEFYTEVAVVDSVDLDQMTCDVTTLSDDLEIFEVRLNANEESGIGVVNIPVEGSNVLISYINKNKAFVSLCAEVEKTIITYSSGLIIEASEKISIKNNGADLKTELDKLLNGISALTVPTAFGPSGTPINVATFTAVKTNLNLLLE